MLSDFEIWCEAAKEFGKEFGERSFARRIGMTSLEISITVV
jgi:hypothetical protein